MAATAVALGVVALAAPAALRRAVRASVREGLAPHDLQLQQGEIDLSPLSGTGDVSDLLLLRERPEATIRIHVAKAHLDYGLGGALADPPTLRSVSIEGLQVAVDHRARPHRERLLRALHIEHLVLRDAHVVVIDASPKTVPGDPFRLELRGASADATDFRLEDVVGSALLRARVEAELATGGQLHAHDGDVRAEGVRLAAFSTYLTHVVGVRLSAGSGRVWLKAARGGGARGLRLQVYLEVEGLRASVVSGGGLLADVSAAAIAAFLNARGDFFVAAFPIEVPDDALTGRPDADFRALGRIAAESFVTGLSRDRLRLGLPEARPLHGALADAATLAERVSALSESQRRELFDGALAGRTVRLHVVDAVRKRAVLAGPYLHGTLAGTALSVRVRRPPAGAEGDVSLDVRLIGLRAGEPELIVQAE